MKLPPLKHVTQARLDNNQLKQQLVRHTPTRVYTKRDTNAYPKTNKQHPPTNPHAGKHTLTQTHRERRERREERERRV